MLISCRYTDTQRMNIKAETRIMTDQIYSIRMSITSLHDGRILYDNLNTEADPMRIVPDKGYLFPKLEQELFNLGIGQRASMYLLAHDAFGDNDEKAVKRIALENLADDMIQPGQKLSVKLNDGNVIPGIVVKVDDDNALIDFNHPLAGQDIKVEVLLENVVYFKPH